MDIERLSKISPCIALPNNSRCYNAGNLGGLPDLPDLEAKENSREALEIKDKVAERKINFAKSLQGMISK